MTTAYTDLLGFALPVTGELSGTWGTVVNDSITELVEDAIAATATASVTSGNWTLTDTGGGAHNQARCAILIPTGTPGTARSILAPNSSKAYIVDNQSDSTVTVKGVTGPTSGAAVAAGSKALVAWNGSDFVVVASGDVDGPASSTDNAFARFDGTSGKIIQNSTGATLDDSGNASFAQVNITAQGDLRLEDTTGGEYVAIQAPGTLSASYTLTLPGDDGSANQVLATDGSGGLSWVAQTSFAYPGAGMAVSTGSAWGTSKTTPSGDVVGTSDTQILTNKSITNPSVTNYTETLVSSTGNTTVDLANGTIFKVTTNGSNTITLPASAAGKSFLVIIAYTGAHSITWAGGSTIKWNGGTAPTATSVNGKFDIYTFFQDGTNTYGSTFGSNF